MSIKKYYNSSFSGIFSLAVCCILLALPGSLFSQNTITSVASGYWNDVSVWNCACIPDSTSNVIVSGDTIELTGDVKIYRLTIGAGSILNANNFTIFLKGNWTNSGNFLPSYGTVVFYGPIYQFLYGADTTDFYNVIINSSAGVSQQTGAIKLHGTLSIENGTFSTNNLPFILISDSLKTARIAEIKNGTIMGNINVERFTPSAGSGYYRFLSSPIRGQTLSGWVDDVGTLLAYKYNETDTGNINYGYVKLVSTDSLIPGEGYWIYGSSSATTFDLDGQPVTGNFTFPVTYTVSNGQSDDGWNLLGNPYPSTIDWDADTGWTRNGLSNAVYILKPDKSFSTYIKDGPGINGGSRYIPSSQAFWVHANALNPVLTCSEKVKDSSNVYYAPMTTTGSKYDFLRLRLEGFGNSDQVVVRFLPNAYIGVDNYDAFKFKNGGFLPNISALADTFDMAINSLPELSQYFTVQIRITVLVSGTYKIVADDISIKSASSCIILEDVLTNTYINLKTDSFYSFYTDTTSGTRFKLHIYFTEKATITDVKCFGAINGTAIYSGQGNGPWNFFWMNSLNDTIKKTVGINIPDTLTGISNGIYYVSVSDSLCPCLI